MEDSSAVIYVIGFVVSVVLIGLVYRLVSRTSFGHDLRASAPGAGAASTVG